MSYECAITSVSTALCIVYLLCFVLCAHVFRLWMCQDDKEMYQFCCMQSLCSITVYYCVNAKSERQSEMHNSYS